MRDLEIELYESSYIKQRVLDNTYAQKLYSALCNIQWYTETPEDPWTCTWRYAGGLVAGLREQSEDYMDYYCSGIGGEGSVPEGVVDPEIERDLKNLGWKWRHWPK